MKVSITRKTMALLFLASLPLFAVNVMDFGAKGDGFTDDTDAIQLAMNAASEQMTFAMAGRSESPQWGGHGGHGGGGEVFLPSGIYRLSRPLVFAKRRVNFRGEEGTVLLANPDHDILYLDGILRIVIENIAFHGGRTQLNVFTNNNDMTMVRVENCVFTHASAECIRAMNKQKDGKGLPPYQISTDSRGIQTLSATPDYDATTATLPNSTLFAVVNCSFFGGATILHGGCDSFLFEDCRIMFRPSSNSPFAVSSQWGKMDLRRVRLSCTGKSTGSAPCWFASKCLYMNIEDCDFDNGEQKMAVVFNSRKPGYEVNSLRIANSRFILNGAPLVRYEAGTLTGILELQNNANITETPSQAVAFDKAPTAQEIEDSIRYQHMKFLPIDTQFKMLVSGNKGFQETLPESLAQFKCQPLPQTEVDNANVKLRPSEWWPKAQKYNGGVLRPLLDTVDSLQKACDNAKAGDRIVLPPKMFVLSDTVRLPAGVELSSEGICLLVAEKPLPCLLRFKGSGDILCRNLAFAGADMAVDIASPKGRHLFQNCSFLDQKTTGVNAMNHPEGVLLEDSVFFSGGGLRTNGSHSEIRRNWVNNTPSMNDIGFFICKEGEMIAEYNLFVPILPRVNISNWKPIPEYATLPNGNNVRWFDCIDGRLALFGNRLGGEFQGMTPVYLFGKNASLLFRGGYSWFGNAYTRKCMVYCNDTPKCILLQGIVSNAEGRTEATSSLPCNVTGRDPKTNADIPALILPQIKATAIVMYK